MDTNCNLYRLPILLLFIGIFYSTNILLADSYLSEVSLSKPVQTKFFEFIYINANSGQSSGGHTAIKFNDLVYHFQLYPDGIFHIVRESWFDFRFSYNIHENRSLEMIKIFPQITNSEFWERGFNRLFLIQEKHLQNWKDIQLDVQLLESNLSGNHTFSVEGLGYIDHTSPDEIEDDFYNYFKTKEWRNYSLQERNRLWKEIQSIEPIHELKPNNSLMTTVYPMGHRSISSEYIPRIQRLGLLESISNHYKIHPQSLVRFQNGLVNPPSTKELEELARLETLLQNKFKLILYEYKNHQVQSQLLIWNTLLILKKIRTSKDWWFLDTLTEYRQRVVWNSESEISPLSQEIILLFNKIRILVFAKRLEFQEFLSLQDAANRVIEIQRSRDGLRPIRHIHGRTLPKKKGMPATYPSLNISRGKIKELIIERKISESMYENKLKEIYSFNLILQNCTSEIFFSFDKFYNHNKVSIKKDLGKHIDPLSSLSFIPFYASYDIKKNYTLTENRLILSYRLSALEKLKANAPIHRKFLIEARESFVPTSKLYNKNSEDHSFLFFTDNTVLFRPILGLGNLFNGIVVFISGIPTYPWDDGKRMMSGIQGSFFSLPELFFFNINKGSFLHLTTKDLDKNFPMEEMELESDNPNEFSNLD